MTCEWPIDGSILSRTVILSSQALARLFHVPPSDLIKPLGGAQT
jgi:hypothetical protein